MTATETRVLPHLRNITPYASARSEHAEKMDVMLDANENPFETAENRYPDPEHRKVRAEIALQQGLSAEEVFVGNGSDEAIDLIIRLFCYPGKDAIMVCQPTYGMYQVSASIMDVRVIDVPMTDGFRWDIEHILERQSEARVLFLCSPNNPTGNSLGESELREILLGWKGIVVLDEAYIDFSLHPTMRKLIREYDNLIVLQTFSKAWGMAGLRAGIAFANPEIIAYLYRIKSPYNLSAHTQERILQALAYPDEMRHQLKVILHERDKLMAALGHLPYLINIYPSDANFILIRVADADHLYRYLLEKGIVVRNRNRAVNCAGCLRITIGTPEENQLLLVSLHHYHRT